VFVFGAVVVATRPLLSSMAEPDTNMKMWKFVVFLGSCAKQDHYFYGTYKERCQYENFIRSQYGAVLVAVEQLDWRSNEQFKVHMFVYPIHRRGSPRTWEVISFINGR